MAIGRTSGGVGYVVSDDPRHPQVTTEDTQEIARTIDSLFRQRGIQDAEVAAAIEQIMALAGLSAQSPADGQTAALVQQQGSLTAVAIRALLGEHLVGVRADAYGVVGDGVTDDTDALHAAAAVAAQAGLPLVIPGGMAVGISSYKRFPTGLTLVTNGSKFTQLAPMGRAPVVGLGPRSTVVGGLLVDTLGGDACQGVHIADASDVTIDHLEVVSAVPGAGKGNIRDNGLRILNSPGVRIGRVFVENYSWSVWAERSNGLRLGWVEVSSYAKAVHIDGCSQLQIQGGHVYGTAPNTQYAPGYNGLLIGGSVPTQDIHIQNFTVEDAGEHGYRLSGSKTQTNVWFGHCVARNSGGTGFKVLGGDDNENTFRNRGITFNACTAIDSGSINQNCCGFLIQRADDVRLISPTVKKDKKARSAVEGIRMSGVSQVRVISPKILDTHKFAIHVDEACGNIQDVTFTDTHIQTEIGHGIYLQNPGVEFRDIRFKGGLVEVWGTNPESAGAGFYAGKYTAAEDSGTWMGMNELEMTFSDSTGSNRQVSPGSSPAALASFIADITVWREPTAATSWPPFAPGSMLLDRRIGARLVRSGAGPWLSTI